MMIIILAIFVLNILWAVWNWKKEFDEVRDAFTSGGVIRINWSRIFRAMFNLPLIVSMIIGAVILAIFPPLAVIVCPTITIILLVRFFSCNVFMLNSRLVMAIVRFGGDIAITTAATGLFGFSGFYGSALAIFMSNVLSIVFFVPRRRK